MPLFRRYFLAYGAAALAVAATFAMAPALADKPLAVLDRPIGTTVTALPIDFDRDNPDRQEFGKLIYRGGLNLFAKSHHFGGYSGIALDPSGRTLLGVSDAGTWLRADLDYDGRKLKGLSHVVIGPILDKDEKPVSGNRARDAEAMALVGGHTRQGTAYVGFERDHRILRYPFTPRSFGPPTGALQLPAAAKRTAANRGIEAIAVISAGKLKGTFAAFSERLTDKNGNLIGWLIGGRTTGAIALKRIGGFDITDLAPLPDGGLLVLERRFRFSEGVKMRIRRIGPREIRPGALISGEILLEARDNLNIDNMEAIATHRRPSGETIITLMSDDNFSAFQRTLIMQFELPEARSAAAN